MSPAGIEVAYLVAAVLFIAGLKRLSSPATARSGNALAALGMLVAVAATLLHREVLSFGWILAGALAGGAIGAVMARTVRMTAMPQMVALFNGFGGAASALVAGAEFVRATGSVGAGTAGVAVAGLVIGAVTFSGSVVAYGKLQELIPGRPLLFPGERVLTGGLALVILVAGAAVTAGDGAWEWFAVLAAASLLLGVFLVIPIGGADMPVIVALLNSYSGLAASAAGFVLGNSVLIVAGALVGASGLILTAIMCRAMNRSLANVFLGAFGALTEGGAVGRGADGPPVREVTAEDAAILVGYARRVMVVPGYGLAVAQAQHAVRELAELLEERGVEVRYAIHPVAGRMPGHMNVLLAEADVPYPQLLDLEQANPKMERTEVVLVIGANDVVNPAARDQPGSPIYGMPILNVDEAKQTIVLKRSMNPGFAGVENELFFKQKTAMLFGDAKDSITQVIAAVKAL
ncbi:MAG: NAD(P)(+) transhydrogenase (Re/Si-specific) subunit beta [Longimicrobiaceae bacterium]